MVVLTRASCLLSPRLRGEKNVNICGPKKPLGGYEPAPAAECLDSAGRRVAGAGGRGGGRGKRPVYNATGASWGQRERIIVAISSIGQPSSSARSGRSLELALAAAQTAAENRGRDIVVLDMRELTPVFDYFVLATGASRRQLHAMSEEIDHKLEQGLGDRRLGLEGYEESRWILLDYGDVVIHLFEPELRDYYALEDLWCDAKRVPVDLPVTDRVAGA